MPETSASDMLIAGGGVAGASGSLALLRAGHNVTVVDHDASAHCAGERRSLGGTSMPGWILTARANAHSVLTGG